MEGRMWLMGDVSAMINVGALSCSDDEANGQDVKPAKEIMDDMIKEAKQCLERGSKVLGSGSRAKL